ncbi:uncharacterized protein LOC9654965 [Selaginella moellendorffii]|uniref:uncharacterized protein LOC9654965 n=1 Tax=Selaginella moellendorffii TaxID=88036 RepID=UPI000D1C3942|nr:uncharacterized protein LOC9654965 [Selaginella moellendorffii]|eukprot:XP_024524820.1 uncharacterized protein LOC9654965 [Selaginella moellendorffii]
MLMPLLRNGIPKPISKIRARFSTASSIGATLRDAKLAYKTYGSLNAQGDNAIVYPTWFSGRHWDNEWLIGSDMGLDPSKYFIIVPNMLGNGLSTSPSNSAPPYDKARFPNVRVQDNVRAQHKLVTEEFGIQTLKLVFLEGVKAALASDDAFQSGWYNQLPTKGLRAAARVYAGWGFSQAFYWNETWRELGFSSLEDFLVGYWEGFFLDDRDPNNLLAMLWTWKNGNVGLTPGFDGSLERALASIQAKAIVMPAEKDLYFPPEDEEYETSFMPNAKLRIIPGVWGHFAGTGLNPVDAKFIDDAVKELLNS